MDSKEIERLANLARIELTESERDQFALEVSSILGYISEIKEITGDAPEEKVVGAVFNVVREDSEPHASGMYTDDLLRVAPDHEGAYIKVKKILGDT